MAYRPSIYTENTCIQQSGDFPMADLVLLFVDDEEPVRCLDIKNAKQNICSRNRVFSKAWVEIIPEKGGLILSLDFDRSNCDWGSQA